MSEASQYQAIRRHWKQKRNYLQRRQEKYMRELIAGKTSEIEVQGLKFGGQELSDYQKQQWKHIVWDAQNEISKLQEMLNRFHPNKSL